MGFGLLRPNKRNYSIEVVEVSSRSGKKGCRLYTRKNVFLLHSIIPSLLSGGRGFCLILVPQVSDFPHLSEVSCLSGAFELAAQPPFGYSPDYLSLRRHPVVSGRP